MNPSKDYNALYDLICKGEVIPCFVDYDFTIGDNNDIVRDVAKVKRHKEFYIIIGVRGLQYGGVYPFHKEEETERHAFIKECKRLDLEYYQKQIKEVEG